MEEVPIPPTSTPDEVSQLMKKLEEYASNLEKVNTALTVNTSSHDTKDLLGIKQSLIEVMGLTKDVLMNKFNSFMSSMNELITNSSSELIENCSKSPEVQNYITDEGQGEERMLSSLETESVSADDNSESSDDDVLQPPNPCEPSTSSSSTETSTNPSTSSQRHQKDPAAALAEFYKTNPKWTEHPGQYKHRVTEEDPEVSKELQPQFGKKYQQRRRKHNNRRNHKLKKLLTSLGIESVENVQNSPSKLESNFCNDNMHDSSRMNAETYDDTNLIDNHTYNNFGLNDNIAPVSNPDNSNQLDVNVGTAEVNPFDNVTEFYQVSRYDLMNNFELIKCSKMSKALKNRLGRKRKCINQIQENRKRVQMGLEKINFKRFRKWNTRK